MQGCTRGPHSNEKPQEPLRPEVSTDKSGIKNTNGPEIIYQGPKSAETLQKERPRCAIVIPNLFKITQTCSVTHANTHTEKHTLLV